MKINLNNIFNFNLIEFWFFFIFLIFVIISLKINYFTIPFLMLISKNFYFIVVFVLIFIITIFCSDGNKNKTILPIINHCIETNLNFIIYNIELIESGSIVVLNYPSCFIEYLILPYFLLEKNINFKILMTKKSSKNAKHFIDSDSILTIDHDRNNFEILKKGISEIKNTVLIVYPELDFFNRKNYYEIQNFKSGIFEIASQLKKSIVIGFIDHLDHSFGILENKKICLKFEKCLKNNKDDAKIQMINLKNKIFLD